MPYLVDTWTFIHLLICMLGASLLHRRGISFIWVFAAAIGWEFFELLYIEPWLNFHEPWYNRWGSDLVVDLLGALIGKKIGDTSF